MEGIAKPPDDSQHFYNSPSNLENEHTKPMFQLGELGPGVEGHDDGAMPMPKYMLQL